mmetsp:Transcript_76969/g.178532  ORF Transcript_76969/g.178532 Transcript_76969/m.178532 type:complete len:480 (+) Transcript_76969:3-1442(+)
MEKEQFDECLKRIAEAEAAACTARDAKWTGHYIIRGCCHALKGVILLLQRSFVQGIMTLGHAWALLRKAEAFCEDSGEKALCEGTSSEIGVVRSVSLFICGVVGLLGSLLPESIGGLGSFMAGIPVDRALAVKRLEACWAERGLLAPWACAVALAYHVDVRFFLGEEVRAEDLRQCDIMLQWALGRHRGSIIFSLLKANLAGLQSKNSTALFWIDKCAEKIEQVPALGVIIHGQRAKFAALSLSWNDAAASFDRAADVNVACGRRTMVPTLRFAAALCAIQANNGALAQQRLASVRACADLGKKDWQPSDRQALRKAAAYAASAEGLPPLLDLLELLELKLHALRRLEPDALCQLLSAVEATSPAPCVGLEARRLRFASELARLLRRPAGEVSGRLEAAMAACQVAKAVSKETAEEVCKDATEALVMYSLAEFQLESGQVAAALSSSRAMQRLCWRAEFWVSLSFKAATLERRVRAFLS